MFATVRPVYGLGVVSSHVLGQVLPCGKVVFVLDRCAVPVEAERQNAVLDLQRRAVGQRGSDGGRCADFPQLGLERLSLLSAGLGHEWMVTAAL